MWRSLPFESKKYYKILGSGKKSVTKKVSGLRMRKLLNSGNSRKDAECIDGIYQKSYSWMEKLSELYGSIKTCITMEAVPQKSKNYILHCL